MPDVEERALRSLSPRVVEELADDRRHPRRLVDDRQGARLRFRAAGLARGDEARPHADHAERRTELVRDAGRELSDGLQPIDVLESLALGHSRAHDVQHARQLAELVPPRELDGRRGLALPERVHRVSDQLERAIDQPCAQDDGQQPAQHDDDEPGGRAPHPGATQESIARLERLARDDRGLRLAAGRERDVDVAHLGSGRSRQVAPRDVSLQPLRRKLDLQILGQLAQPLEQDLALRDRLVGRLDQPLRDRRTVLLPERLHVGLEQARHAPVLRGIHREQVGPPPLLHPGIGAGWPAPRDWRG